MLDQALKDQLIGIFSELNSHYELIIKVTPHHTSRLELIELLSDVASCSDKIDVTEIVGDDLEFVIAKDGEHSAFVFRAVPNGHEFTTLLLAILNLDGKGKNLPDAALIKRIQSLQGEIYITSYISLTCTNCPDVVQALNVISIYNPNVHHCIVDGAIAEQEIKDLSIQAVPSVYVGNEVFHIGKSSMAELIEKLVAKMGISANIEKIKHNYDVVVAGGGPAGATAAIYSARKGFKVALVTDRVGGQVLETQDIENITSLKRITGHQYAANILEHIKDYPIDIFDNRKIEEARKEDSMNLITTSMGEEISSKSLIIATGASWRKLNIPGETDYIGRGVAFCTHCDGPFYKDKKVVVVGGGNSGLEAAIDLSNIAKEITIVEFLDVLKGDQVLQDKIASLPNVKVVLNAATTEVQGNGTKVIGLVYRDRTSNEECHVECDGIFIQIGLLPNSKVFENIVNLSSRGEIEIDVACRTNTKGVYAAGDVTTVPYKQIVVAKGEGAKAALSSFEDLSLWN